MWLGTYFRNILRVIWQRRASPVYLDSQETWKTVVPRSPSPIPSTIPRFPVPGPPFPVFFFSCLPLVSHAARYVVFNSTHILVIAGMLCMVPLAPRLPGPPKPYMTRREGKEGKEGKEGTKRYGNAFSAFSPTDSPKSSLPRLVYYLIQVCANPLSINKINLLYGRTPPPPLCAHEPSHLLPSAALGATLAL